MSPGANRKQRDDDLIKNKKERKLRKLKKSLILCIERIKIK